MSTTRILPHPSYRTAWSLTVLLAVLAALLPATPASAARPAARANSPTVQCAGLEYLDKLDLGAGGGRFDVGGTAGGATGDRTFEMVSDTGLTISFELDGGETHEVTWTSATPIARVVVKAGRTASSTEVDGATAGEATVAGPAISHITFCFDPEASTDGPGDEEDEEEPGDDQFS